MKFKDPHEEAAEAILEHARCNVYVGPPVGGDMYAGWPMQKLVEMAPRNFQAQILVAMAHKMNQQGVRMSIGSLKAAAAAGPPFARHGGPTRPHSLEEMMAMRMRWGARQEGALAPWAVGFTHMAMHAASDVVHIWIITIDGQSLVLEDEFGLYPSDALITKIRLLQRGE